MTMGEMELKRIDALRKELGLDLPRKPKVKIDLKEVVNV